MRTKSLFCLLVAVAIAATPSLTYAAGDTCVLATTIPGVPFTETVNTTGMSDDMTNSRSAFFGGGMSPDVFWAFTPTSSFIGVISMTGFDTGYAVYTGPCGTLVEVEAEDEFFGPEKNTFSFTMGTAYHIMGEGFAAADFGLLTFNLNVQAANDECANAPAINNASFPIAYSSFAATKSIQSGAANVGQAGDVWHDFTASGGNGGYTFTLTPTATGDGVLAIFDFNDCTIPLGSLLVFDAGGNSAPETTGQLLLVNGTQRSFFSGSFSHAVDDNFTFGLAFVPGASVEDWKAY